MLTRARGIFAAVLAALLLAAAGAPVAHAQAPDDRNNQAPGATTPPETPEPEPDVLKNLNGGEVPLAGPIDPATYRLGPGDVLSLELSGRANRQTPLVVDAEGRINVPELGVLAVGGETLANARAHLIDRLRSVYQGVRIDVRILHVRTFKIFVTGEVHQPGSLAANAATRASEVFRGDHRLEADASRRNIELHRRDGTRHRVDLDAFAYMGRAAEDPLLEDGDVLLVPPRTERMYALGGFGRPGEYEYAPGDSIGDLIGLAGGLLPGAEVAPGSLVRFTQAGLDSFPVDFNAVRRGDGDRPLVNQDRLYARVASDYLRPRNVTLVGEFMFPGPYALHEGPDRLSDVIAQAGGLTPDAARERIQVFRPATNNGQRDIEFERLSRLSRSEMTDAEYQVFKTKLAAQQSAFLVSVEQLSDPNGPFNVTLRDGDIIVVDRETSVIRVGGEVRRPSLIDYAPGRKPMDYVELAGGLTNRAQGSKIRVTRAGSNQTLMLDDVKSIQPGDFIWVPEKSDVSFWDVFKDVITVAGAIATILVLVDNTRHH